MTSLKESSVNEVNNLSGNGSQFLEGALASVGVAKKNTPAIKQPIINNLKFIPPFAPLGRFFSIAYFVSQGQLLSENGNLST
jgi:hypothetical protein